MGRGVSLAPRARYVRVRSRLRALHRSSLRRASSSRPRVARRRSRGPSPSRVHARDARDDPYGVIFALGRRFARGGGPLRGAQETRGGGAHERHRVRRRVAHGRDRPRSHHGRGRGRASPENPSSAPRVYTDRVRPRPRGGGPRRRRLRRAYLRDALRRPGVSTGQGGVALRHPPARVHPPRRPRARRRRRRRRAFPRRRTRRSRGRRPETRGSRARSPPRPSR